jgi:hypothetical protein
MEMKRCSTCGETKCLEFFAKPKLEYCKPCNNKRIKAWRDKQRAIVLASRGPVLERTEKRCKECLQVKPLQEFYKQKNSKWYSSYCKPCCTKRTAILRKSMPSSRAAEKLKYKTKRMGTTAEWFESRMQLQDGKCAICKCTETHSVKRESSTVRSLAIDHDHDTGKVRGLLCFRCNTSIHLIEKHGLGWLDSAVQYLKADSVVNI